VWGYNLPAYLVLKYVVVLVVRRTQYGVMGFLC
jgi:hypothetical protein